MVEVVQPGGSGGGGSPLTVTDGITPVVNVTTIDFTSGAVVTDGGGGTANVAISGAGATGYTGYTGPSGGGGEGSTGYTGYTGYTGPGNFTGYTGYTGPIGPTGYTGYTGPIGPTGYTGYTGPGNFTGYTGYTGYTGPIGPTGYTGYTGPIGPTGYTGYTGPGNFTGYTGYTGYTGPIGPTGYTGYTGYTGPGNFTGYTGYTGYTGPTGYTGYTGPQFSAVTDIVFIIDGGGSAITTGIKGDLNIDFACTITQVTLLADQSGSIVIDIWKDTYANYPPTDADSITASAPPTISSATKSQDATLTGWTTSISAGDTLRFNVDSITTCTRVALTLRVTKS